MRGWLSLLALIVVSCSASSLLADDGDTYSTVKDLEKMRKQRQLSSQNIWWEHLIPGRIEAKKQAAQQAKVAKEKPKADDAVAVASKPVEPTSRQTELNKALRREAVCQRLREIAEETNDPELAKLADQLELKAWDVYEQKMASAKVTRFQPMSEADIESKLLKNEQASSGEAARAEIRTIRGDKKE